MPVNAADMSPTVQVVQAQGAMAEAMSNYKQSMFRRAWPAADPVTGRLRATDLRQYALALRGFLREQQRHQLATDVWACMEKFSDPLRAGYGHADESDAFLSKLLASSDREGMPEVVATVTATHIAGDMGMRAWQHLCKRTFISTEDAAKLLKDAVSKPDPEMDPTMVVARLSRWDSDLAEVLASGYTFDQHDQRSALYGMVTKLDATV